MKYASLWKRLLAAIIDLHICIALAVVLYIGLELKPLFTLDLEKRNGEILAFLHIVFWIYFAIMESSNLQATFGKMILKLKVTNMDGNRISFWKASVRYWGKVLIPFAWVTIFFTKKKQWFHDQEWLYEHHGCVVLDKRNNEPRRFESI